MIEATPGSWQTASLEGAPTGLAGTVGFKIVEEADGTIALARTTVGVVEITTGVYAKQFIAPTPPDGTTEYLVVWDLGDPDDVDEVFTEELVVTGAAVPNVADAGELVTILGVDEDRAQWLVQLATRMIAAALEPNPIPDPLPETIRLLGLGIAIRLNDSPATSSGQVVSESIGSYTYRLARARDLAAALQLTADERRELAPWATSGRQGVYQVDTSGLDLVWPDDWWQRDLDSVEVDA